MQIRTAMLDEKASACQAIGDLAKHTVRMCALAGLSEGPLIRSKEISTRILGRRTAHFPPFLIPYPRPAWFYPIS